MAAYVNAMMALVPAFSVEDFSMSPKQAAKDQDKFVVRLPDGMRERIRAKADRAGMSMNEAVVWCLEQYFPAPQTLDDKLNELIEKVALLKGDDTNAAVEGLIREIDATLSTISGKTGYAPKEFSSAVSERYTRYLEEEADTWRDQHEDPFDDANWGSHSSGDLGGPVEDPFSDPKPKDD